ncbi:hypothetical protein Dimus_006702 [Dionaea muscipula]
MSQQRQFPLVGGGRGGGGGGPGGGNNVRQYHDTTYTKIFVGGLAWETQRDTMRSYFEQFGEIFEAVVISDKYTGRSKGYGFVTFKEPEAAFRACQNPSPVIDGRRANCNLAAFGALKPKPPTPQYGPERFRPAAPTALVAQPPPAFPGPSSTYFHQPSAQLAFPYSAYGYSGYSHDTLYPMNYYGHVYGGQQLSPYYTAGATTAGGRAPAAAASAAGGGGGGYIHNLYPYYSPYVAQSSQAHGLGVQYPPHVLQYPYLHPHPFATSSTSGILSLPTTTSSMALPSTSTSTTTSTATTTATTTATCSSTATTTTTTTTTGAMVTTMVAGPAGSSPSQVTGSVASSERNSMST